MAFITPIGANPEQIEYRLSEAHGCGGTHGTDRQFSYHTDGRERPLRWIGRGLHDVGIEPGSVLDETQFDTARALMNGIDPRTGEVLVDAKRAVADDAKVALGPLVRAVEAVAAEADVSTAEVLGHNKKLVESFDRARRAVDARGEAARLRADEAGRIADAAGVSVDEIWGEEVYEQAAANLYETVQETQDDGTVREVRRPRRVRVGNAGYDVTMTLPKSFSVLLAFADEETAAAVERVYMEQVQRTFAWLESATAYGMRGKHGNGHTAETVPGSGFLGWTMVHRAARPVDDAEAGDPHWHVHITVANMTKGSDGQWSTVAAGGRDLMRHAPAVDHMLKALVRHELSEQFGIQFARNDRSGAWEIVGIPDATLLQFSKRHGDIDSMLETLGYDRETASKTQERIAEQRSRGKKSEVVDAADATLQHLWQGEAEDAGHDPHEQIREVFRDRPGSGPAGQTPAPDDSPSDPAGGAAEPDPSPSVEEIAAQLLDPEHGLTAHSRRFTRADAVARVADALPNGCASADELDALTDAVLATAGFLELPEYGQTVDGPNGGREHLAAGHMANAATYTTQDVVDAETVILRAAKASHADQLATRVGEDVLALGTNIVEAQQPYPLDEEQHAALRRLVTHGYGIDTVTGRPGSGKTTLMRAVRTVYEAAGYVIGGAATAAVAAQNLETESGISSRTVASYVNAISEGHDPLRGVDVLVVDEANLTEDRDRAALYLQAAKTGTKIVEVGDGKQLRGVGVGSLFGRVHEILGGAELRNNRRQAEEDERAAIEAFREGRYVEAFSIWHGNGRFHATDKNDETTAAMVSRWWAQRQGAPDAHTEMRGLVMLAATNAQVRRLNDAAQAVRLADGELGAGRTYDVAGAGRLRLHVGDHILVRVNDRAGAHTHGPPVLNGYRAVIRDIDEHGTITADWQRETPDGLRTETAQLSARYVGIGGVELGYGMTIHKAEGLTVGGEHGQWQRPDGQGHHHGRVLFYAPGADNPAAYVALSRHKQRVDIFGALEDLESEQQRYLLGPPRTAQEVDDRAIERLAEHARNTDEHGDDRPVVADLGVAEFLSETAPDRQAQAAREAEDAEAARLREERTAEYEARARRRAERERERAERAETTQRRRDWAAELLREVWRHEPTLAENVIMAAAFDTVARNLADAHEAGYDVREVLADLPTSTIASPRVQDPARFTAWGIDHAVERLRTGDVHRDDDRVAERARFEQMRDQTADLLDEVWSHRPELVERIVQSQPFDTFVRSLDYYTTAGLDPRELLRQVNVAKLDDPSIREPGAFAAYSLRRVGDRQLDEIDDARQRAEQRAQIEQHQREAADTLRQAWSHVPDAAETVITGPAFRFVADELAQLRADGHAPEDVLASLSPDTLLAAPQPAGATAHALKQQRRRLAETAQEPAAPERLSDQQHQRLVAAARATVDPATTTTEPADPDGEPEPDSAERDRLAAVTAAAAEYYQQQLDAHPSELDYLAARLPDVDTARQRFTIGYAPDEWRAATDHLRQLGYSDEDLLDAGIAKQARNGGLIDRMRGRIVLAVRDDQGRLAGFIGRDRTGEEHAPKYLNTPGTALYDKSRMVFGLAEQRDRLAAGATPVLVEGTFDVMALATSEAGQQVVPVTTSGTAVTTHHLQALHRATGGRDVVIGLDGDEAGQAAAARAAERTLQLGMDARVVTLPDGHDPASWVQDHVHAPEQAATPYLDPHQQRPAAELLAERAVEDYFAAHPPQHRDEVEGRLAAARAAAAAIRHVDLAQASATGMQLADRLSVDPVHMASLLAEARAVAEPAVPAEPGVDDSEPAADTEQHPPAPTLEESPDGTEHAPVPEPAGPVWTVEPAAVPDWRVRAHGQLSEQDLQAARTTAEHRRESLQQRAAEAHRAADELREQVQDGRGPAVAELDEHQAQVRQQAELATHADDLDEQRQATVDRAAEAAAQRARAEAERDELGRFAVTRRRELDARIVELREVENTAQDEAEQQAARLAPLVEQVGDREQRRQVHTRARAVAADDQHARPRAQQRDEQRLAMLDRQAARLAEQAHQHQQYEVSLTAEAQLRHQLPAELRQAEDAERAHAPAPEPAEVTAGGAQQAAADPSAVWEARPELEQQAEQEIQRDLPDEPEL